MSKVAIPTPPPRAHARVRITATIVLFKAGFILQPP